MTEVCDTYNEFYPVREPVSKSTRAKEANLPLPVHSIEYIYYLISKTILIIQLHVHLKTMRSVVVLYREFQENPNYIYIKMKL